jgi:hypothetical protein
MENSEPEMRATVDLEKWAEPPESTSSTKAEEATVGAPKEDVLTGFKLYMTLFSVGIVGFLITLDVSIVVTVRDPQVSHLHAHTNCYHSGHSKDHSPLSLYRRHWLVRKCVFAFQVSLKKYTIRKSWADILGFVAVAFVSSAPERYISIILSRYSTLRLTVKKHQY